MTTVQPPVNPNLPQMLAAVAAPTATIAQPPPKMIALPPGTTLTGPVTTPGPDPRFVVVDTPAGKVEIRTPVPLPDNATLTMEVVRTTQQQVTVRLIALDGQALQQALAQAAKQQTAPTPAPLPTSTPTALPTAPGTPVPLPPGQAWWPSGPQALTALPQISAYVMTAVEGEQAQTQTPGGVKLPTLATGMELSVRITSLTLPNTSTTPTTTTGPITPGTPQTTPSSTSVPTATAATATPQAPTPAAVQTPSAPAPTTSPAMPSVPAAAPTPTPLMVPPGAPAVQTGLGVPPSPGAVPISNAATPSALPVQENPGLTLPNRATGWTPIPTPPTTVAQPQPQITMTGTVILSPTGVPLVQTPEGQVQINVRANLPVGTVVTFEVAARQAPSGVMTPSAPMPGPAVLPLAAQGTGWPTLTEAIQLLQRSDPTAAAQLANVLPDGGARSALAVMSLVQALRTGEARQWPGDSNLRALEKAGPRGAHLAAQLAGEVGELSRQVRDTGGEWRQLPIPWQTPDGRVERVRVVVRETDGDEDARKKGGGGTRFLVDLDLSRLGPLQLDGMFRKETRSLEMMIRTHAPLPETMRVDLAGLFANSNAAMNLKGGLSFQVVKKFPDPLAGPAGGKDKSGLWA